MTDTLWDFVLGIPQALAQFTDWLVKPISDVLPISPLGLFGVGGGALLISIIVIHVVRLFL